MMSRRACVTAVFIALLVFGIQSRPAARLSVPARAFDHKLRVMTYNIHVGVGMDKKLDLGRIAEVIKPSASRSRGIAGSGSRRSAHQRVDEIAEIAKLTHMEYAFAFNLAYQGGQYGVAILSRLPIIATDHRLFKNLREAERRGFIRAEVDFHGRKLNFATTHLDYQFDDGRQFEVRQLLDALKEVSGPLIVVGDFNDTPDGGAYKLMRERFDDAWMGNADTIPGFSYPADKPAKRIDYILLRNGDNVRTRRSWVVSTLASDHIPVIADLEVK
jgi:endonuclease/exonuclease/phosphatase family metal-dependent hydrolase